MKCSKCHHENPPDSQYCSACGTRLDISKDPLLDSTIMLRAKIFDLPIGSTFAGRYQIIEELGRGGMGTVYKVLDREIDEKIALKVLKPEISYDLKTIERFRNELKIARKISQPNVCRMYDLMKERGTYFITMEYVSGEDLKSTIARVGQLSVGKALIIAKQICAGLSAAHQLGIVHRDLKPHNIMIDRAGNVRIMDFGIARSAKTSGLTESGAIIGTPEYMSPEQAVGEEVDIRSDIYSLGVVLFELVTGKVPFEGTTAVSVAMKHKSELPPNPRSINEQIPEDFNRLILKCLEKEKRRRYQNAGEVLEEISQIERGFPTTDKMIPERMTSKDVPGRGLPKFLVPGVLVLAAAILIVGAFYFKPWQRAPGAVEDKDSPVQKVQPVEEERSVKPEQDIVAQNGLFEINSEPEGAEIYLGDTLLGKTPDRFELPPGKHVVKLMYPGYKTKTEEIDIEENKTFSERYILDPEYLLKIKTVPAGARVKIDGKFKGTTGSIPLEVENPGDTCRLNIEKTGYKPIDLSLTLKPGDNFVTQNLERLPSEEEQAKSREEVKAREQQVTPPEQKKPEEQVKPPVKMEAQAQENVKLIVRTVPSEADVFLDGTSIGKSPTTRVTYPPGNYRMRIEKAGYQAKEVSIDLKTDFDRTYRLEKYASVLLRIIVQPWANVYIDGVLVGEVPPIKQLPVEIGQHTIELKRGGQVVFPARVFQIRPGKDKEISVNLQTGKFEEKEIDLRK